MGHGQNLTNKSSDACRIFEVFGLLLVAANRHQQFKRRLQSLRSFRPSSCRGQSPPTIQATLAESSKFSAFFLSRPIATNNSSDACRVFEVFGLLLVAANRHQYSLSCLHAKSKHRCNRRQATHHGKQIPMLRSLLLDCCASMGSYPDNITTTIW